MDTPDALALLARLAALREQGKTIRQCASELGKPRSTTQDLVRRFRLPGRRPNRLSAAKRRTLERHLEQAKHTLSEIARRLRIAKSTVCDYRRRRLQREAGTTFNPRRLRSARRCGNGHLTQFWPCVICAAAGGSDKK
jgi:transposase